MTHIERETYPEWTIYQTLSDSPSFIVLSNPSVMLADYVTLVMSCFGTWFGLSFLDFFPIQKVAIVKTLIGKNEPKTTVVKKQPETELSRFTNLRIISIEKKIKQLEEWRLSTQKLRKYTP